MSFQQIQKQPIKETNKNDKFSANNDISYKNNSEYHNQFHFSNDNTINFNFSKIGIFNTGKNIQRKSRFSYRDNYPRRIDVENIKIPNIQTKLKVSQPSDPYEKEADRIAEQVMRRSLHEESYLPIKDTDDKKINPKCKSCEQGEESRKMKFSKKENNSSSLDFNISDKIGKDINDIISQQGSHLDTPTREFMESKFGYDFGNIRIHTDSKATRSANLINSLAFAIGNDLVFNTGQYRPNTESGLRLLTHELVHVIQGGQNVIRRQPVIETPQTTITQPSITLEQIRQLSEKNLQERIDNLNKIISNLKKDDPSIKDLKEQVGLMGVEIGRKNALRKGRTFDDDSINRIKTKFVENAAIPAPKKCIVILNEAMIELYSNKKLKTTNETIEKDMMMFQKQGLVAKKQRIRFLDKNNKDATSGAREPDHLEDQVFDVLLNMANHDIGWSVFGLSIADGHHAVTLTLDNNDPSNPKVFWSDQWSSKGGFKQFNKEELQAEIQRLTILFWNTPTKSGKRRRIL